jgi:hypothetical protein
LAWVIGLNVIEKVFKYHEALCQPICCFLLALPQNLISLLTYLHLCFQIIEFLKSSLCKKTCKIKDEVSKCFDTSKNDYLNTWGAELDIDIWYP